MQINQRFPWRLIGFRPTGDVWDYTLYTNKKGSLVCYVKTRPGKPFTARQLANMRQFTAIASLWTSLSPSAKRSWVDAARKATLSITAYNLFVYANMQPDRSTIRTIQRQTGENLGADG
jgi:hypothetical protein